MNHILVIYLGLVFILTGITAMFWRQLGMAAMLICIMLSWAIPVLVLGTAYCAINLVLRSVGL